MVSAARRGRYQVMQRGISMAGEFAGKVVVITGGSRGIGRGIAEAFAREGATLVLAASSADNLASAAELIKKSGAAEPLTCAGDLRTLEALPAGVQDGERASTAAATSWSTAPVRRAPATSSNSPDEAWSDGFALKLFAAVRLSRLFWPLLKASAGARGQHHRRRGAHARIPNS